MYWRNFDKIYKDNIVANIYIKHKFICRSRIDAYQNSRWRKIMKKKSMFIVLLIVFAFNLQSEEENTDYEEFKKSEQAEFNAYSANQDSLFRALVKDELEILNSYLKLGEIDSELEKKAAEAEKKFPKEKEHLNPQKQIIKFDSIISQKVITPIKNVPKEIKEKEKPFKQKQTLKSEIKLEIKANRPIYSPLTKNIFRVSSPFNKMRTHPILRTKRPHNGIDLAAKKGTPVYATADGKVMISKFSKSAGNYIKINHKNGYYTYYMHLEKRTVRNGDIVKAGQVIGYVGNTGISSGSHLHYEIRKNENAINPAPFMKKYF